MSGLSPADRVKAIDWDAVSGVLDDQGWAVVPKLLDDEECDTVARLYGPNDAFRSHVIMARHGFGRGEYRYLAYPLPPLVAQLRETLYPPLAPLANQWHERMRNDVRFPADHAAYIRRCHDAGQERPTPLILRYGKDDFNALHQDLYGEHVFPFQVTVLLSAPETDFSGGEFVLVEQRPRMQSTASVVPLSKGDAVIFAVNSRPVRGSRGDFRANLRHGVSRIRDGHRHTLGVIFHDAN
jgi:hypothetical protein